MTPQPATRRTLVRSLAALPVAAALFPPRLAMAQTRQIILFDGIQTGLPPGAAGTNVMGWAAETPDGWVGRIVDSDVGPAQADFPGFAAGATAVVPKGTPDTLNANVSSNGIRHTDTCLSDVRDATIQGSFFRIEAALRQAQNNLIFVPGDPVVIEGNADAGEFTFTIRAAGRDRGPLNLAGTVMIA